MSQDSSTSPQNTSNTATISEKSSQKYCVNVSVYIKPERREEFLKCLRQNQFGTLTTEPLALLYVWGEDINESNTFHLQEQYIGEEGFIAHTQSAHFAEWRKFAEDTNSPFTKPPVLIQFFERE
jgi:quinol monooxygenase YgiN